MATKIMSASEARRHVATLQSLVRKLENDLASRKQRACSLTNEIIYLKGRNWLQRLFDTQYDAPRQPLPF